MAVADDILAEVAALGLEIVAGPDGSLAFRGGRPPAELLARAKDSRDAIRLALTGESNAAGQPFQVLYTDGRVEGRDDEPASGDAALYWRRAGEIGWAVIPLPERKAKAKDAT